MHWQFTPDLIPWLMTAALLLMGMVLAWGLIRFRQLDIVSRERGAVIEGAGDGIIVLDTQNRIIELNLAARRTLNGLASSVIGQPADLALSAWPDLLEHCRAMTEGQAGITLVEGETRRDCDLRVSPLLDRRGRHIGRVMVLHNITERKRAELALRESEERYRALIESQGEGMGIVDPEEQFTFANSAAEEIFGVPSGSLLGHNLKEFVAPGQIAFIQEQTSRRRQNETSTYEIEITRPDGGKRSLLVTAAPRFDSQNRFTGAFGIFRDITDRKQTENELRAQKQLFENLVSVARATAERPTLEATLHNALDVSVTLTGAEQGDLFLTDASGAITSRVLVSDLVPEKRQAVLERVMDQGLAGWVARHRQAALIADTSLDDRWLKLPDRPVNMRSALSVPILSGSALSGVLTLTHSQPGHFTAEHLQFMQAASDQMALAVRNAQIFDEQRRMADRQMTLYQIIRKVSGQLDPDAVARAAANAIAQFAGWPHVAIVLPDKDQQHWVTRAASGFLTTAIGLTLPLNQGVIGRAIRTAQTQLVPDVSADPDYAAGHPDIRSELAVPLRHGNRISGVLNLESDHLAAFDAEDVLLAESLADALALALDNARLYAETRQRAADLSALYAISRATSQSLALDQVLAQTLSSAIALFGFDAGLIGLVDLDARSDDERPASLRPVAHRGLSPAQSELIRHGGLEGTLCAYVFNQRESMVIGDLDQEQPVSIRAMTDRLTSYGWRAYAGIPLLRQKQALGVLCLFARKPRTASAYDLALLTTIGHQVATAVENAQLFQSTLYDRGRLQALIKSTRDGVLLIGMDGRILVVNAQSLRLLALPGQPEDWLGWRIKDALRVLHIHAPQVVRALLEEMRRAKNGDEPPGEGEFELSLRAIRWLSLPVMVGATRLGRLLLFRDVTDERAVERLREDMTGTMVHDLRNPLSAIYSALIFLKEDAADLLSADQREMLEIGLNNSQRMLGLVNNILDVSRLESGRMPLNRTPVEMGTLIAETLRAQAPLTADKGLRLESDVPPALPPAWVDAELIGRVLQNLAGNAIKFTPAGGVIRLEVKSGESGGRSVLLVSVSDNGPGIPDEIRSRLFQRFVTGRQQGRGSGLGLAFCKVAVEAHGEHIWVESAPGQGTTFTFSLPISSPPPS